MEIDGNRVQLISTIFQHISTYFNYFSFIKKQINYNK
jgi:hypothetical protein